MPVNLIPLVFPPLRGVSGRLTDAEMDAEASLWSYSRSKIGVIDFTRFKNQVETRSINESELN
jgi:hypothetical protein